MSPETMPLIYEPKPLVKQAARYRKLSNNSAEWGRQIQDALYNEQKQLNTRKVQVIWESKDDTTGNAVGRVVVDGKIAIPVIVNNFKLAPLDTFTDRNVKPHRLSPGRLKKALFNPDLFSGIITPQDERGLMPDIPLYRSYGVLPWEEGRRVYASAHQLDSMGQAKLEKLAQEDPFSIAVMVYKLACSDENFTDCGPSLLDTVLATATSQDLEKFAQALNENPQIAVNFHAYGMADMISQILNTRPTGVEKVASDLMERLPVSVVQFRLTPDHKLLMKLASDGVYAPQEVILPNDQFAERLEALGIEDTGQALRKAASPTGLVLTLRSKSAEPIFGADLKEIPAIDKFGHYVVKDISGKEHRGTVFPQFYALSKESMPRALFLSDTLNVMQGKIAGLPDPSAPEEVASCVPQTGDTGVFVYEKGAEAIALEPVTIKLIEKGAEEVQISAETLMGLPVRFHLSKAARDLVPLKGSDTLAFLLPLSMKFAKLSNLVANDYLVGDAKTINKMASTEVLGPSTCRVTSPVGGRLFLFQGPLAEKMGSAGIEQYPDEALFKLACMGLSADDAQGVLDRATATGSVIVGGLRDVTPAKDILGHEKRAMNMQVLASIPQIKKDPAMLLKIAGDVQDPTSVDRVLGLGVLGPQNYGILVDHMGDLENTGVRLSEMLLATRMGAKDMNESAIIQARQAIDDVLDGLSNLKSRLGPQTSTSEEGGTSE